MREITFELLRHGPTNNQLLSPLTQYLALCGNHAAVTVQVPFEHNQFLHRLRALSYQLGDDSRTFQVRDTARALGDILGQIPGLIAELNRDPVEDGDSAGTIVRKSDRFTHLRIISSASELALLPFELALTPSGFPGAGQSLLLQSQEPICMTREVRRVAEQYLQWPANPRVLFVAAAPANVGEIPLEDHLGALQRILEPWVGYADTEEERQRRLDEHLVVLKNASCRDIQNACAGGQFSHVHILAHGVQYTDGYDVRFGLALHDPQDPTAGVDKVSGERLATILRAVQPPGIGGLARPIAVTLASCDGANVGTVAGMGASLAHALHAAGIPMVVASQFPISVAASITFVDILYSGLMWGEDPRISLNDLRRRLHSAFPTTHDWASVTAYLSLPPQFERQLSNIQIDQTMRSIEVAMTYADRATAKLMTRPSFRESSEKPSQLSADQKTSTLEDARRRVEAGRERLEHLLERTKTQKGRVFGLLAATEKRCAEVYFSFSRTGGTALHREKLPWPQLLDRARQHYWEAFLLDRSSWAVVQYLSLTLLFQHWTNPKTKPRLQTRDDDRKPEALWTLAHVLSINDLRTREDLRVSWALANLAELYLIALLFAPTPSGETPELLTHNAKQRAADLVDRAGQDSFEVYSTRRQILRYVDWYREIATIDQMALAVEDVLSILPLSERHARE